MVEFAVYTGLHASELADLEVADLKFAPVAVGGQPKCSLRVDRTETKGKRADEGWIVGTPKSKRSRRAGRYNTALPLNTVAENPSS